MLKFRDTGKEFELKGHFLKMIANKNYNVDLASLLDKKLIYDFAKEIHFDLKAPSNESTRDRTPKEIFKSPAIMALGVTTIFLSEKPDELVKD